MDFGNFTSKFESTLPLIYVIFVYATQFEDKTKIKKN